MTRLLALALTRARTAIKAGLSAWLSRAELAHAEEAVLRGSMDAERLLAIMPERAEIPRWEGIR